MTEKERNDIKDQIEESTKAISTLNKSIQTMHEVHAKTLGDLKVDMAIVKEKLGDVHKTVFGNGVDGLKTQVIKLTSTIEAMKKAQDEGTTDDRVVEGRVKKLENKWSLAKGIMVGMNVLWGIIVAVLTIWKRHG